MRVIQHLLGPFEDARGAPMDAMQLSTSDLSYADEAPVLIGASSEAARIRAVRTVEAAGRRIADCVSIEAAQERIARQVAAAAVWIELDEDCGGAMDALLTEVSSDVAAGRYAAVVSSTAALVDAVVANVVDADVEVVVDALEADRAVALTLAAHRATSGNGRLSDIAADQNAARLRQLSDEVSRIATMLSRLSTGPEAQAPKPAMPIQQEKSADISADVSADMVRTVIRARRLRTRYFADHLFADPAWDMLLDLFQAEIAQLRVPVSSLCIAAAVPATTALRWLKTMVQEGIFVRRADPHDGRRVFVELAPSASDAMRRYFADVGKAFAI
jgi:DNA-binding MarR family transcriptional regulator